MYHAVFTLAWFGVLRPCEAVPLTAAAFDVSKHPTVVNIKFFDKDEQIHPHDDPSRWPTHMVMVVKQSKTDQERALSWFPGAWSRAPALR